MLSMPNLLNFEYHALMLNGINMKSLYEKMHFFKFSNNINVNKSFMLSNASLRENAKIEVCAIYTKNGQIFL